MLSKNQMVAVRKTIESTYHGTCTVTEYQRVKKENKSTGFQEVVILTEQPCKLSFEKITSTSPTDMATSMTQTVKVLIAPDVKIKNGSKLTISQNGVTTEFENSGEPALFYSHQEIMLTLFRGWA